MLLEKIFGFQYLVLCMYLVSVNPMDRSSSYQIQLSQNNYNFEINVLQEETPTPSPPTTGGCGAPEWATDAACDDENNNAGCNWDDGACCGDDVDKTFCTKCECIDPNA